MGGLRANNVDACIVFSRFDKKSTRCMTSKFHSATAQQPFRLNLLMFGVVHGLSFAVSGQTHERF